MQKFKITIPLLLFIFLIIFLLCFNFVFESTSAYKGYSGEKYLTIKKGEHTGEILENLEKEKVVKNRITTKIAYAVFFKKKSIKAGVYLFDKEMTPIEVLRKLTNGEGVLLRITLKEGLTIEDYAKEMAEVTGKEDVYLSLMKDPSFIKELDPKAETLEGYIFPETYFFAPFTSEKQIIKSVVDKFSSFWNGLNAKNQEVDLRSTIILSSIVEMETPLKTEKPRIAGVFLNRLRMGMPLQSDPTTIYALKRRGLYRGYLLRDDLKFDDPFNTYVYLGLPPAPICSPSKETILSVINYERNNYLYFVAKDDKSHYFSENLENHNKAVSRFIKNGKNRR